MVSAIHIRILKFLLGILPGIIPVVFHAQNPAYQTYKNKDLPVPYFTGIDELADGRLAFSSWAGLCTYDGKNFEHYSISDGMPSISVQSTFLDSHGRFWMHTARGLCYLENDRIISLNTINPKLRPYNNIKQLYVSKEDTVYLEYSHIDEKISVQIYSSEANPNSWDKIKVQSTRELKLRNIDRPTELISTIALGQDRAKNLVNVFIGKKNKKKITYTIQPGQLLKGDVKSFNNFAIFFVLNHLIIFRDNELIREMTFDDNIHYFKLIGKELWVMFENGGVARYNDYLSDKPDYLFREKEFIQIWDIFKDFSDGYWFLCAAENGLIYVPDLTNQRLEIGKELHNSTIATATVYNDSLFIGYFDGSIGLLNNHTLPNEKMVHHDPGKVFAMDLTFSHQNRVYASYRSGLFKYDSKEEQFKLISNVPCASVGRDTKGKLYLGLGTGGVAYLQNDQLIRISNTPPLSINKYYVSGKDTMLTTHSDRGLFIQKNGRWKKYSDATFFNQFVGHYQFGKTEVYTSYGTGLLFTSQGDSLYLSKKDGLISELINSVYRDQSGTYWIATGKGINWIKISQDLKKFEIGPPIRKNQNVLEIFEFKGQIWYSNYMGIETLNRNEKKLNYRLRVKPVTKAKQDRQGVYLLENDQIGFRFRAIHFNEDENIVYEYQLKGKSEDWITTTEEQIQFSLPSGSYEFLVRVKGQPATSEAILFVVPTPFWKSWWFILTVLIVIASIIWRIVYSRLKQRRLKHQLMESELKALRAQMNPHFTFNSLNSIQNFILKNEGDLAISFIQDYSMLVRMMLEHSSLEYISLQQELEAMELYLKIEQWRMNYKFDYQIHVAENLDSSYHRVPSMILQPFIENAIWHGISLKEGKGKISINASLEQGFLHILVEDDGVGRATSEKLKSSYRAKHKSMGIKLSENRLKILSQSDSKKYQIRIIDLFDQGTPSGTRVHIQYELRD
ncbi:MAG: hypothetical protein EP338_05435 [Bacteroidetes bacterium]|nr:MAG: hypothetical protein EP338_05435 [Bacteroidota bacterium]